MQTTLKYAPREPESLPDTGLSTTTVEQLILKILYFRGDLYGQDLSTATGLKFSVIEQLVEALKLKHHLVVKRSLGMGGVSAVVALTEAGRVLARESLDTGMYAGPAPVPLEQYVQQVRRQRPDPGWLTKTALARALRGMVITERVLSQIGPALSSGNSMLVYGKPGDGKTYLIESLHRLESSAVFVPHAIDCGGNIIRLYDPVYHDSLEEAEDSSAAAVGREGTYDRRYVRCKRPFIVTGGELTLDMLDLRYNHTSKLYEAPFQLKANNGIYLIDDFGRQIASPAAVLNRWIVPMERRVDYLSFVTGGKMTVPFEAFLVFSTNLNPQTLGDEAFLRRMEYKLLLRGPAKNEFVKIFENACKAKSLPFERSTLDDFIEKRYEKAAKEFRRCQPRDVLTHATNLMEFERLPYRLTPEILDRAFESCFVQEQADSNPEDSIIVQVAARPCMDYWTDRVEEVDTLFGKLGYLASLRDRATGNYRDAAAEREYDIATVSNTLLAMHTTVFRHWVGLKPEQQRRELAEYLSTAEGRAAFLSFDRRELSGMLTPPDAQPDEKQRFHHDLTNVLMSLSQRPGETAPSQVERIA